MPAGPIADWSLARRVAGLVASRGAPASDAAQARALRQELHHAVGRADPLARRATGLGDALEPADCVVVSRRTWIDLNAASLAWVTAPLADKVLRRPPAQRRVARTALGFQLGVVLGYLSTRVLGQYEVLRPHDATPGRLLLVGPNLLQLQTELGADGDGESIDPAEVRFGIVLHELGHRLQFEGVPWLRDHLRGLLDAYIADAELDSERLKEVAGRVPELLRDPSRLTDPARLAELVLTPQQSAVFARAQALMSLLEGHGNVVMDWGAELTDSGVNGFDASRVRRALNSRRNRAGESALRRALGLSLKAQQYAVGERFILDVAERHGRDAFARVWEGPEQLPRTEELDDPDAWVRRTAPGPEPASVDRLGPTGS